MNARCVSDRRWHTFGVLAVAAALALTSAACAGTGAGDESPELPPDMPGNPPRDTRSLIEFVDQAAQLVEQRGPGAIEPFAATDGPWWDPDVHLFVIAGEGDALYYSSAPHVVGRDVTMLMDLDGRPFGHWQLEAANRPDGRAWAFYTWPRPHELGRAWTATYSRRVEARGGQRYVVGAGLFDLTADDVLLRELARHAASDLHHDREAALRRMDDDAGPYAYRNVRVIAVNETQGHVAGPRINRVSRAAMNWLSNSDEQESDLSAIAPARGHVHRVEHDTGTHAVLTVVH